MRIGIDVMGGDHVPHAPIAGLKAAYAGLPADVHMVLIGPKDTVLAELARQGLPQDKFELVHAEGVIGMDEHPAKAITQKPEAGIPLGVQLVKEQKLDAFISAGNTGAMLVASVLKLGNIDGVARPTIGALYPYNGNYSLICDVGANADCKPEHLVQFGILGSVFMQEVMHVQQPRVALLNIGEEKSKGNQLAQQTHILMENQDRMHFVGNAEGRDINHGTADVYVCDGFTGNIVLKFGESFYYLLKDKLPAGDAFAEQFNFERIGGLPILGVKGNVIVGHGISGPLAFQNMVLRTIDIVRSDLIKKIERALVGTA